MRFHLVWRPRIPIGEETRHVGKDETRAEFALRDSNGMANVELKKLTLRATVLGLKIGRRTFAPIPRGQ